MTKGSMPSSMPILSIVSIHLSRVQGCGTGTELDGMYLCQCLVMALVESTMVPSISKRIPANVWVSAAAVKAYLE